MEILTGCRVTVRAPTGRREELALFDQVVRMDPFPPDTYRPGGPAPPPPAATR